MMNEPLLTVLSFSGGSQSSALLWMVLTGVLEIPKHFVVLNADPGMENNETYRYVEKMRNICQRRGIPFHTVEGPNLYEDIINLKNTDRTRLDNPPYWTKSPKGKKGRLTQGCTKHYKIAPMDRWIRQYLHEHHGINPKSKRLPENCVQKWIGFSADETHRVKEATQKYVEFRYPLIDLAWDRVTVEFFFKIIGETQPPRSVCNACFANSPAYYREMKRDRPDDFAQAVTVDESVRDWSQIGVNDEVYVCNLMIPLKDIDLEESSLEGEEFSCDEGYCFV